MPSTDPTPLDPSEILTNQRLGTAISTLADPDRNPDGLVAHLDEHERHVIRDALNRSRHPLVAVAQYLLDQWDRLDPDDRVAGLLLFAEIVNRPHRQRAVSQGVER